MTMNTNMKPCKVITARLISNDADTEGHAIITTAASNIPEKLFVQLGLDGKVASYEVSDVMPYPYAKMLANQLRDSILG